MFNDTFVKEVEARNIFDDLVNLKKGDILVAIAFPRYSKLTIEALKYARDNYITVIGLTDGYLSPIREYSKYTLFAELSISTFINSLVAPMSLINSLIMAISLKNKKTVQYKFEKLEKVWDEYGIFK
jgi:DNA-binding MurR/RpiR family transcriptional regulator